MDHERRRTSGPRARPRLVAGLVALALAVTLAACDPSDPDSGAARDRVARAEPAPVDARYSAALEIVTIEKLSVRADGRTVDLYWWGGNPQCEGARQVTFTPIDDPSRSDPVRARLYQGVAPGAGPCTAEGRFLRTTATLPADLARAGLLVVAGGPARTPAPGDRPGAAQDRAVGGEYVAVQSRLYTEGDRPVALTKVTVRPDGRTLDLFWAGGNTHCAGPRRVTVERLDNPERGDPVVVTLHEAAVAGVTACSAEGRFLRTSAALPPSLATHGRLVVAGGPPAG